MTNELVPDAPPLPSYGLFSEEDDVENAEPNMIVPYLYLGSIEAAYDFEHLKKLEITHILSLIEEPLEHKLVQNRFKYMFKQLVDSPWSDLLDILDECIEFIKSAVENSCGVLVHWLAVLFC